MMGWRDEWIKVGETMEIDGREAMAKGGTDDITGGNKIREMEEETKSVTVFQSRIGVTRRSSRVIPSIMEGRNAKNKWVANSKECARSDRQRENRMRRGQWDRDETY